MLLHALGTIYRPELVAGQVAERPPWVADFGRRAANVAESGCALHPECRNASHLIGSYPFASVTTLT
jgi:hypothetical protein